MYNADDIYFADCKQNDKPDYTEQKIATDAQFFDKIHEQERNQKMFLQEANINYINQNETYFCSRIISNTKGHNTISKQSNTINDNAINKSNKNPHNINNIEETEVINNQSNFNSDNIEDENLSHNDEVEYYISDNSIITDESEFSNLSGLSDISGQEWKPVIKPLNWVQKQIHLGANPREILSQILANGATIAPNMTDMSLWRILASMLSEPPRRQKLRNINTIDDVVNLLKISNNIIVLTGAGVSVSCGIPDFRSNDGIYSRLAKDFPDLPDPQAMFDISYFSKDPRPFYKFAREIYPGQFIPSPCHRFIKLLEKKGKLLRNYTQNIDTLERVAGIENVIECHGSFATASCTRCTHKTTADEIRDDIFAQRIPLCPICHIDENNKLINSSNDVHLQTNNTTELVQQGIMKPDIVFFGEGLPNAFHTAMANDKDNCDLLIVIGSSLKVRPVALIPSSIPRNVPQILINREQLSHLDFDVELLGDSDIIINQLCHLLGSDWTEVCWNPTILIESNDLKPKTTVCDSKKSKETINLSENKSSNSIENKENNHKKIMCPTEIKTIIIDKPRRDICDTEPINQDLNKSEKSNQISNTEIRHISMDSSKDSGICDSYTLPTSSSAQRIQFEEENDRIDVYCKQRDDNKKISCIDGQSPYSLAERLYDNTYYSHPSSSSYVFPGGQVYWNSKDESSDTETNDEISNDIKEEIEDVNEKNNDDAITKAHNSEEINNDNCENDNSDDDSPISKRLKINEDN